MWESNRFVIFLSSTTRPSLTTPRARGQSRATQSPPIPSPGTIQYLNSHNSFQKNFFKKRIYQDLRMRDHVARDQERDDGDAKVSLQDGRGSGLN